MEIKFGTDGYRGILDKTFTLDIVRRIVSAIILYLKNLKSSKNTVIVGYDPRKDARMYAEFCAELLRDTGFKVILSERVVPTPIVAYCAKYYPDSIGAIMFTASHNPPEYQGIKFIPDYGGPAEKEITDSILSFLDKDIEFIQGGEIIEKNLEEDYFKALEKIIDFEAIKKANLNIIYDGLYSSSISYFDKLLDRNGIKYLSFNMHHDPAFGGGLPEPKPQFLKNNKDGYITVANDGDADRYGVIDEKGNYVHPNTILALLLRYLVSKGYKGSMAKTVGVSNLVEVVAKKLNVKTITTPVGFKWLSSAMRNNDVILAGEDSGGLSIGSHIPEKDGLLANLLILEMVANENKTLFELNKDIKDFAGCEFYVDRVDVGLKDQIEADNLVDKFSKFDKISDFEIKETLKIDGIKLYLDNLNSSLLIRKSGTEPLLRFYIESDSKDKLEKIKDFVINNTKL